MQSFIAIAFPCNFSTLVEHAAVNRRVVGSSPTWGAKLILRRPNQRGQRVMFVELLYLGDWSS